MNMAGVRVMLALLVATTVARGALIPRLDENAMKAKPWVTVSPGNNPPTTTITPTVKDGKTTSAFPGNVAMPTGDAKGNGAFIVCHEGTGSLGAHRPFCAPEAGSEAKLGKTYYVTWDTSYFESSEQQVQIQGNFKWSSDGVGGQEGFTSDTFPGSQGYYVFDPAKVDLPNSKVTVVQFYLAYPLGNGSIGDRDPGPTLWVLREEDHSGGPRRNIVAIVLPVIFGLLALAGICWFVFWFGRRKGWFFAGKRQQGYGIRKSKPQRSAAGGNIKLNEGYFSPSPRTTEFGQSATGGNVFREEIRRQEQGR